MATRRFNYKDDWVLKDGNIGINSETPAYKLDVASGTVKTGNVKVSSGSTFTNLKGYLNTDHNITYTRTVDYGTSSSLSGNIVVGVGNSLIVGSGVTTGQGSIKSLKVSNTFNPPIGGTVDRPSAPQPGALYYNKDFKTIEYWDGNFWRQVDNVKTSGRGVCSGGWNSNSPTVNSTMDVFSLTSHGNAIDFGNLAQDTNQAGSVSNSIRGIVAGGGPGGNHTHMEYYAIVSGGIGIDFGNLNAGRRRAGGLASSTRGLICGGRNPGALNAIDYMEIMTLGDAQDFGDLTSGKNGCSTVSSPTHGIITNGYNSSSIDKVTIASKGNAVSVGEDMFFGGYSTGGASTGTRGVWAGGYGSAAVSPYTTQTASIRGIDIASGGNSIEFGNLHHKRFATYQCGTGSCTRGFWMGGADDPAPGGLKAGHHIDYVDIRSGGNSEDWGDLTRGRSGCTAFSDCHGGLGGF